MNTICNGDGKVWQMLATKNGTFALRYAKFSIKKRSGTGRFISKPPISVVLPKVELENNNDNNNATTIFIDNTDIINMNGNIQISKNLSNTISSTTTNNNNNNYKNSNWELKAFELVQNLTHCKLSIIAVFMKRIAINKIMPAN